MSDPDRRRDRQYLSGEKKRPEAYRSPNENEARERHTKGCGCGRDRSLRPTRRQVLGAAAAGITASTFSLGAAADQDDTYTIVHDLHSHSDVGDVGEANIARYQTLIQEHIADRDDALFVTTGDELGSSLISFFTEGQHKVDFMNDMGITAAGVGNHDFDYGIDATFEKFENSEFPWITSNLKTPEGEQLPETEPYHVVDADGIRVGIFNVVLRGFHNITNYPDDYIQEDPVERAAEMTEYLYEEEDCDSVVLSSHVNHETHYEIAAAVDGLDAIFGSHSHITFDDADSHEDTVISEIGYAYAHLGVMTLDSDGNLVDWQRIDLDEEIDPDPEFKQRLEELHEEIDEQVSQPAGRTAYELDAWGGTNYSRESHMGNLITDAMLDYYEEADVAFQNAGGIRTNDTYGPGELTVEDILSINPFDNEIVLFEAEGWRIRSALGELGLVDDEDESSRIDALPDATFGAQQGQQVAGIQYEWSGHEEPAVHEVYVNGEPLQDDETYTVATTDYIKDIASGYEAFHEIPEEDVIAESGTRYGPAVVEYLTEQGVVEPAIEGRILRVDEVVGAESGLEVDGEAGTVTMRFETPEHAHGIYPDTFTAITEHLGASPVRARDVAVDGEEVLVTFDHNQLLTLATGPGDVSLRVFGGFDPDSEAYGYEDEDGELRELPVSAGYEYFVMKGTVEDSEGMLGLDEGPADADEGDGNGRDEDDEDEDGNGNGDDNGDEDDTDAGDDDEDADDVAADDPADDPEEAAGLEVPGFGPLAALAGVGGAGTYAYLRLGDEEDDVE